VSTRCNIFEISVHQLQHVRNKQCLLLLLLLLEIGTARLTVFTAMDTCMSIEFSEVCDGTVNCQATSRGAGRRYRGGESMRNLPGEGHLSLVRQGMRCLFTIQPRPPGATSAGSQGSNPPCTPVSRNPRTYLNTDYPGTHVHMKRQTHMRMPQSHRFSMCSLMHRHT
jgi:hypothetical protein